MRPWTQQTLKQRHCERWGGDGSLEAGEQIDSVTCEILITLLRGAQL